MEALKVRRSKNGHHKHKQEDENEEEEEQIENCSQKRQNTLVIIHSLHFYISSFLFSFLFFSYFLYFLT